MLAELRQKSQITIPKEIIVKLGPEVIFYIIHPNPVDLHDAGCRIPEKVPRRAPRRN